MGYWLQLKVPTAAAKGDFKKGMLMTCADPL